MRDLSINGSSQWRRYGTADRIMMLVCLTCSAQRKRSTRLLKQRCQHSKNQSPSGLFSSQTRGRERENEMRKKEKNGGKKKRKGPAERRKTVAMLWQRCGNVAIHPLGIVRTTHISRKQGHTKQTQISRKKAAIRLPD